MKYDLCMIFNGYNIIQLMKYTDRNQQQRLILRRNKHYYDIKSLEFNDKQQQIFNRIPQDLLQNANTQRILNNTRSLIKHKTFSFKKPSRSSSDSKRIKGMSMDLTLPRKSFIQQQKGPVTERNFNNFYLQKPNLSKTIDIGKSLGRQRYTKTTIPKQLTNDLTKTYESFYYPPSMMCKFDYKKDKSEGRIFFQERRQKDPSTYLDDSKVYKAFLKVRTKSNSPILFSKRLGKEVPSTLDTRLLKDNQNYWKYSNISCLGEQNLRSKKKVIFDLKKPYHPVKEQVCAQVYFRRKK